ncbi:hypothetical protein P5V15_013306 [Pogonomyrmex californicus]
MADDPNRDILPVKEGSCSADTIISAIDPRERHLVSKLDRYQLEDKYLRLLDEASNLKKLSNCQEDKIKRLGTKLIRLANNSRAYGLALDIADDRNRTAALELENTKLKEKIAVMRNQLLSHTMSGRSSSRSRNLVRPSSSGLVTCRSENNRVRVSPCQCRIGGGDDDNDMQNYLIKIEKLEAQKKEMACRIAELEKELAHLTNDQREKVAENVEYIRVWRQMKQLNDKLITSQEKNTVLTAEINDLKTTIEQTTKNNQEIAAVLSSERTRIAEIDDQMLKAKNSQFNLREKDEQIRDLMNEIKILQQHNNELITLTSKYGQVELENVELKKRFTNDAHDQQTLKIAFNNEQANIAVLKATNERLLAKFQELQVNIDALTVQLASFRTQDKKRDTITISSDVECKKCCEMYDKITQLEKVVSSTHENWQLVDKSVQTIVQVNIKEQSTMTTSNNEGKASLQSPLKEWKYQEANGTNVLSREKILKLLDQAQINTPLDASKIASKEEYASILDVAQRHSEKEVSSQYDGSCTETLVQEYLQKRLMYLKHPNTTLGQMLLILFDVLQEFIPFIDVDEKQSLNHQVSANKDLLIDVNNNISNLITTSNIKQNHFTETTKDLVKNCLKSKPRCMACAFQSATSENCDSACETKSANISTRNIDSSIKDMFDIFSFPTIRENCRKLSYRDISKDFCAEKMVKLKRLKSPRYPRCNLTCHLRKAKDPLSLQEKQKLFCKGKRLDSVKLPLCSAESFPLLITDKQGLIEIHISRLQLSTSHNEKDAVIIEIVSMQLLADSNIMQDDEIQLLYVEYSFLDNRGEDMETVSVMKPKTANQEMVYNYKKKFWVNETTHPIQREKLCAMLAEVTSPNINFTVISEPLPQEREIKDCEEVGYASFNLKQYALDNEYKHILLPIKNNRNRQIGSLKIAVSGLNAIRQCLPK